MKRVLFSLIFISSFLISPVADAWDLKKFEDVHNFACGDFWKINEEAASKSQVTQNEADAVSNMGAAVINELYEQDKLWMSSGHKSYLHELPKQAIPKLGFKILEECRKNLDRSMSDQVDESFLVFANNHWNPLMDSDFNPLTLEK